MKVTFDENGYVNGWCMVGDNGGDEYDPRRTLMLFWITVSAISSPRESWSGTQKKRKPISWRSRNLLSGYAGRRNASLS